MYVLCICFEWTHVASVYVCTFPEVHICEDLIECVQHVKVYIIAHR